MINISNMLENGGIGVLATDTIYGLVARALSPLAVQRVYDTRKRNPDKPCIILLASPSQLELFDIAPSLAGKSQIEQNWPGPVSIILPCSSAKFEYLHRGTNSLAFRVPAKESLRRLLRGTGPLIAPSANLEGYPPARTLAEAKDYFGSKSDFYRRGITKTKPSKLIKIVDDEVLVLRD